MDVGELPVRRRIRDRFRQEGIETLYPPQRAAVEAGICDGNNLVAAIPTASGKTLIAELAMVTADGPSLYMCPLRALAREKHETFDALPGVDAGLATGEYDSPAEELATYDIVVATSEKVDSAIRNGASWVDDLACVVVDEVHLLGSDRRGPTLEVTVATLRRRAPEAQLVALSATVANPEDVAEWLDADLVESTWRPVELRTGVYADGRVAFDDGAVQPVDAGSETVADAPEERAHEQPTKATSRLIEETVGNGGQALSFVRSRREAETLAERFARSGIAERHTTGGNDSAVADEIRAIDGTATGERLADCVRSGVAFHHAGLGSEHRAAVETAFRNREIACLCATPTLAAGVNLPARRVVVRDLKRYTGSAMEWLPVLEVHQMCGRAGRPHLDPYGEAVLVGDCDSPEELTRRYVEGDPEAVASNLADRSSLRTHTLSLVATGFADTPREILDRFDGTFYASRTPSPDLSGDVATVIEDLAEMELVRASGTSADARLSATELGTQVSRQYVRPETGTRIVRGVETIGRMQTDGGSVTQLTALEVVCDTTDMQDTYLGNRERADMYRFARRRSEELTTGMNDADDFERWLESVKTARILAEWIDGASVETLVESYRIGPGDLESRVSRAEWLLGAGDAIAGVVGVDTPIFESTRQELVERQE
ncbi:superfamily II helicase [Halalkaliarchaeum desulfuricum]|uniref:ATP-dependent DNA helicase Hel308 n=1 Tax=Halalkaliarchaeum desulfuricum TaxID=2055893 RepID=A0A343TKR8_9EURY|nr:DEAD/DEAH box helicase [Halalkaliarchaeum desulfuricum]AUX09690.1 superfamily II helicase [Halalkaliarchaeum desulfuricum]